MKTTKKTGKTATQRKTAKKTSMKTVKRAKKVSKIARGKRAKSAVFHGRKEKTVSGLTKEALTTNKSGKVVSKKVHFEIEGELVFIRNLIYYLYK